MIKFRRKLPRMIRRSYSFCEEGGEAKGEAYEGRSDYKCLRGELAAEDLFYLVPDLDEDEEIEVDDAV